MPGTTDTRGVPAFRTRAQQVEKRPPCQAECPNSGDVRGWIAMIAQHEKNGLTLEEACDSAWQVIAERNPLPATIARICPHPCEDRCTRADKGGPVSINALERFLGDWGISRSLELPVVATARYPESIGVVGSGPASLSFAYQMARRGYGVTLYERDDTPGGMLRHAIPDYRLPREILNAEIERLLRLGVELRRRTGIGDAVSLEELRDAHALLFLGVGAQSGRNLGIPGESGPGVVSGIEYLQQRKESPRSMTGQRVIVIGGGNTAIDAARSALRDGAAVTVVYRRGEAEMPAVAQEVEDARAEGVEFRFLLAPVRIVRERGVILHIEAQPMHLGDKDRHGRRKPVPVPGVSQVLPADKVIAAVAQAPDWHGLGALAAARDWLETRADGRLADGVWAGGDDRGPGVAQGRYAAEAAHAELRGLPPPDRDTRKPVDSDTVTTDYYVTRERIEQPRNVSPDELDESEVVRTLTVEEALEEASRCMSCGQCFDCQQCFMYCNGAGFTRIAETAPGNYFALTLEACEGCGKCIEVCPCGYLEPREE